MGKTAVVEENERIRRDLGRPVRFAKHVGPATATLLGKLGINTIGDLLAHFPKESGYLSRADLAAIGSVRAGEEATVTGQVKDVQKRTARFGKKGVLKVGIFDGTGYLYGVWFNQNYLVKRFRAGATVTMSGRVAFEYGHLQIKNPVYEVLGDADDAVSHFEGNRIIPLHPTTGSLPRHKIRRIVRAALDSFPEIPDPLPAGVGRRFGFSDRRAALEALHFPATMEDCRKARQRSIFEELFVLQIGMALRKRWFSKKTRGIRHERQGKLARTFFDGLPFTLTGDQKKAIREIAADMDSERPMNRLLQGEVASGKTIVAVFSLLMAVDSGYQGAIMAPTEVLAEQHYLKFKSFLDGLPVKIALLKGSLPESQKEEVQAAVGAGEIDIVIGTQALIQEKVVFKRLSLVVVDEQHRFGVRQRLKLKEKQGSGGRNRRVPDILIMTATPIPRTLALTLYGDLDVSILKEAPGGRRLAERVRTLVYSGAERHRAYGTIESELGAGRQAYVVCPLIEESDKLEVKAVAMEAARLENEVFPNRTVGFLHGRLTTAQKEKIMADFRRGLIEVLISTTVIEVGVDIPNATVMLVENGERFGLSQLHQLRGRVGRGSHKSFFIVISEGRTEAARKRIEALRESADGFLLAEKDLEIRGEGEILGARQSGLPDLELAKLSRDFEVLVRARDEAFRIVEADPTLSRPAHRDLLNEVRDRFGDRLDMIFNA